MTSSYVSFFYVSMVILSQFLFVSASALTSSKYIDAICQRVDDNAFCMETLTGFPPAVSATDQFSLANIVINLGILFANFTGGFAAERAKLEPTSKTQFKSCQDEYDGVQLYLRMAMGELRGEPRSANYDIMLCRDCTVHVKDLVGGNSDEASRALIEMTLQMEKLLDVAVGATKALGG